MNEVRSVDDIRRRIKELIVERLKLERDPASISDEEQLFGEGLGLDSIDALELVLAVEQEFGVKVEDEVVGSAAFASVAALSEFVREKNPALVAS